MIPPKAPNTHIKHGKAWLELLVLSFV